CRCGHSCACTGAARQRRNAAIAPKPGRMSEPPGNDGPTKLAWRHTRSRPVKDRLTEQNPLNEKAPISFRACCGCRLLLTCPILARLAGRGGRCRVLQLQPIGTAAGL